MSGALTARVPPAPAPPHDPRRHRLDASVGWRRAAAEGVEAEDGALVLALRPGARRGWNEPPGSFGGFAPPATMALTGAGDVYLLDPPTPRLLRFDPCACVFDPVPCFGGGDDPARPVDPRAMAIRGRALYLAEAGTAERGGRVTIRVLPEARLRSVWRLPSAPPGRPHPWRPVGIALGLRGRVWVADAANAAVHRLDRFGRLEQTIGGLGPVRHLATDPTGRVYVAVDGREAVDVLGPGGEALGQATDLASLRARFPAPPIAIDRAGRFDLRARCAPGAQRGAGVFDLGGRAVEAVDDEPLREDAGTFVAGPLDSRLHRCQWHRLVLRAEVPSGAALRVETYTAETAQAAEHVRALPSHAWATRMPVVAGEDGGWDGLVRSGPGRYLWLRLRFSGDDGATPRVHSIGIEFPRVTLRRYLPAVWGEDAAGRDFTDRFLAVFDTIFRSVERQVDDQAALFDPRAAPTDGSRSGSDFLAWLGSWIGAVPARWWPERKRRDFVRRAGELFRMRGTRDGLREQLVFLLDMDPGALPCRGGGPRRRCRPAPRRCGPVERPPGRWDHPPLVLEHYRLRRWLHVGEARLDDRAVLWGERVVNRSRLVDETAAGEEEGAQVGATQLVTTPDPLRDPFHVYAHRFSVFVPAGWGCTPERRSGLRSLVEAERPAHTEAQIVWVEPRFRIGFQSMIGLDSVVGRYPEGVALGGTGLGAGTVVGGEPPDAGSRVSERARVGSTTIVE